MNIDQLIRQFMLVVALLSGTGLAQAEETELCEPFKDSKVDESLVATMLSAAQDGHLYRIKQASSRVGFCVNSKLSRIEGNFGDFQGGIAINPGSQENGQTMVLIKADSLDTDSTIVGNLIKSESFFDVAQYPEVLFVSNDFEWTGPDTAVLKGDLTLRGITKPVIFNVALTSLDDKQVKRSGKILFKATTTINRADYGMDKLGSLVDGSIQLCMSVEALKYETISSRDITGSGQSPG